MYGLVRRNRTIVFSPNFWVWKFCPTCPTIGSCEGCQVVLVGHTRRKNWDHNFQRMLGTLKFYRTVRKVAQSVTTSTCVLISCFLLHIICFYVWYRPWTCACSDRAMFLIHMSIDDIKQPVEHPQSICVYYVMVNMQWFAQKCLASISSQRTLTLSSTPTPHFT